MLILYIYVKIRKEESKLNFNYMNISQLIESTSRVTGYGARNTFSNKQFGEIFLYNKTVKTKPGSSIIEVTMMIRGVTDKIKATKKSAPTTVAAHKVMVAIHGVKQRTISAQMLVRDMRLKPEYHDKEKYTDEELIAIALDPDKKPFKDQTVMAQMNGSFTVMEDNIDKNSEIRIWCSCSSYYWVFQWYNVEKNVDIWGIPPQRYVPKTKKGWEALQKNRPVRNPGRHPGMCKHIMLLLALLMDSEVIAEARGITRNYKANIAKFQKADRLSKEAYEKIIRDYKVTHSRKLQQRREERIEEGSYQVKQARKGVGHWDAKNHRFVENTRSTVRHNTNKRKGK